MEDKGSKAIAELYYKANKNKNEIVLENECGKDFSKAEMVVLACLAIVGREAEMCKLPYLPKEADYDKLIKTLILYSLDGMTDGLRKKEEYDELINAYKNIDPEVYGSTVVYKSMLDNFAKYMEPYNPEEVFILENTKLHDVTRVGHELWGAKGERLESVLEHIYGCLVLAVGLESEYDYDIDYKKLYKMLLIHEAGETSEIKDQSQFQMDTEERLSYERPAAKSMFLKLCGGQKLLDMWEEFNRHTELEGEYAHLIDKLEYVMQVKAYEENNMYDFENRPVNEATTNPKVLEIIENGANSVFDVHYEFDKKRFNRLPCTRRILEEAKEFDFSNIEEQENNKGCYRAVVPRLRKKATN